MGSRASKRHSKRSPRAHAQSTAPSELMRLAGPRSVPPQEAAIHPAAGVQAVPARIDEPGRIVLRQSCVLAAITLAISLLFLGKAFHIDDPLFLWMGRHIQGDPLRFFDFSVNWYGTEMPMHEVTQNPPLNGYYLALAGSLLGWEERSLHLAYLLPTLLAAGGIYALSRRLCSLPVHSTLLAVLTPAFLVSSTSVMCDTWMLALWCWCLYSWIRGIDRPHLLWHLISVILASAACLTKYFAVALIPLLFIYAIARTRRLGPWLAWLAVPVLVLIAYDVLTAKIYGHGLVTGAATYARTTQDDSETPLHAEALIGLFFLGGCVPHVLFFARALWSAKTVWVALAVACSILVLVGLTLPELVEGELSTRGHRRASLALHTVAFGLGGIAILALVVSDLRRRFGPESILLLLWVCGTFLFASFLNWSNNARSILPAVPAVGILIARALQHGNPLPGGRIERFALYLAPGTLLALLVTYGDYVWANRVRSAAGMLAAKLKGRDGNVYFQGHWGFQLYMEEHGVKAMHLTKDVLAPGDLLVTPANNTHVFPPPDKVADLVSQLSLPEPRWMRTNSVTDGAGFYASNIGPLPYVFGAVAPDVYRVFEVRQQFRFATPEESRSRGTTAALWKQ